MMMYGSLSALVGAYFGFANTGNPPPPAPKTRDEDYECDR
jgi:hypothetical protein